MLLEADEENRDFITIYERDYRPKDIRETHKYFQESTYGRDLVFYKNAFDTVYQLNFSKSPDDYVSLYKKKTGIGVNTVSLPDNWTIPETSQRYSYRNPRDILSSSELIPPKYTKQSNNLDPDEEQRQILKIKTGISEYFNSISATGDRILKENLITAMYSPKRNKKIKKIDCSKI